MSKKQLTLLTALVLMALSAWPAAAAPPTSRPNIIFIMADDLGYTDVACFGSKYLRDAEHRPARDAGDETPESSSFVINHRATNSLRTQPSPMDSKWPKVQSGVSERIWNSAPSRSG